MNPWLLLASIFLGFWLDTTSQFEPDDGTFGLTPPIVCREINGYEDYALLEGPGLTADDKLLLYYRPLHFKTEAVGGKHRAHLAQDGRLRRRGEKAPLWTKPSMVDYEVESDQPPRFLYIRNMVGLKGLKPGEYQFEVTLHDRIGKSAPASRTVTFRVIPTPAKAPG